jgi:hypothetical protein
MKLKNILKIVLLNCIMYNGRMSTRSVSVEHRKSMQNNSFHSSDVSVQDYPNRKKKHIRKDPIDPLSSKQGNLDDHMKTRQTPILRSRSGSKQGDIYDPPMFRRHRFGSNHTDYLEEDNKHLQEHLQKENLKIYETNDHKSKKVPDIKTKIIDKIKKNKYSIIEYLAYISVFFSVSYITKFIKKKKLRKKNIQKN